MSYTARDQCHPRAIELSDLIKFQIATNVAISIDLLTEYVAILRSDFPSYCALLLKVKPKGGGRLVSFIFNQSQRLLWAKMVSLMRAGKPLFLIVLKARQEGISTFVCAWQHWQLWRQRDVQSMTIAHQQKAAETMIETMRVFHDELPELVVGDFRFKPELREGNHGASVPRGELYYADRRSWGLIHVAKNLDPRGQQVTFVHETEFASFPKPQILNNALLPQLPPFGSEEGLRASFIIESTPKGENDFYDMYMEGKQPHSMWTSIFLPWYCESEQYAATPPFHWRMDEATIALQEQLSAARKEIDGCDVTREQMYWRAQMIDGYYRGDERMFDQEYPSDDQTCFLVTESKSIYKHVLLHVRDCCFEATKRAVKAWKRFDGRDVTSPQLGVLDYQKRDSFTMQPGPIEFKPDAWGYLRVWEPPEVGHLYVVGGDVAAGTDEGDYSSMCVIDATTGWQVAEYRHRTAPEIFADRLDAVGRWYNKALLTPEINGLGYVVLSRLASVLVYPNLYRWPKWDEVNRFSHKRGWETNFRTKLLMASRSVFVLEDQIVHPASNALRSEMSVFQQINDTQTGQPIYGAARGRHDDLVIAFQIAVMALLQTPKLAASLPKASLIPSAQDLGISAAPFGQRPQLVQRKDPTEELRKALGETPKSLPWNSMGGPL